MCEVARASVPFWQIIQKRVKHALKCNDFMKQVLLLAKITAFFTRGLDVITVTTERQPPFFYCSTYYSVVLAQGIYHARCFHILA